MNKNLKAGLGIVLGLGVIFATVWVASKAWTEGSKKSDTFGK